MSAGDGEDRLLLQVADGDLAAFSQLYDLIIDRVCRWIRMARIDPTMTDQMVNDTLVEVWRTAPLFDPAHGNASAWVSAIAHNILQTSHTPPPWAA